MAHHVHRITPVGTRVLINEIWYKVTSGMVWKNQLGSIMVVKQFNGVSGQMSGTYTTKVGCSAGTPQPMTGWIYGAKPGTAIAFSVSWVGCDSLTSWTGQFDNGTLNFKAQWYLARAAPQAWNGINAGSDSFTLVTTDKMTKMKK